MAETQVMLAPDEVRRFFTEDLVPLAQEAQCDGIYICAPAANG